jgi:hypothetical protein
MNDNFLQELAEGLRYITKWDDYEALAALRAQPENTKKVLIAAADLLKPLEKQLLFSMVKNANNKTIPAFETIPDPLPVIKDAMAARFKVGNTYLIDDFEIKIASVSTHGVTGSGFVRLFSQIKTIELVKEPAIA